MNVEKFDEWAIVEIMGHKRFAGRVTEQSLGGVSFVRIDVPLVIGSDGQTLPPFTKLFGAASIYCISPCTEETARLFACQLRAESFSRYEAPRLPAPKPAPERDPEWDAENDDLEADEEAYQATAVVYDEVHHFSSQEELEQFAAALGVEPLPTIPELDPDEWVTQDVVEGRRCDQFRLFVRDTPSGWNYCIPGSIGAMGYRHGHPINGGVIEFRCRRKDFPVLATRPVDDGEPF